jgi:hypothetical protein
MLFLAQTRTNCLALKLKWAVFFIALSFFIFNFAQAAAPSVISKGTASAVTSGSITPSYPASPLANDIIFLLVIDHQPVSIGVINTPTGFTEAAQGTYQDSTPANQGRVALFWRRAAGGESGTVSVSRTGDTGPDGTFFGQMYLVRGAITSGNPWDVVTARYGPGNATVTWDAVNVIDTERTLLAFTAQTDDVPGVSTPTGYTRTVAIDITTTGTDAQLALDDKSNVTSDGQVTAAGGETLGWATFHVSVKPPDTVAPAAVSNLAASNATQNTIDLAWTAPGDDGAVGTATTYDVRYSTAIINEGNWASATQATGEPTPSVAGTNQSMTVSGLTAGTTYYFAIKTSDEIPNTSAISNVVSLATTATPDTSPPTPNPMTFAPAPANDSASQISMTSTTGSDATTPVNYLFTNDNSSCGANTGTGGTSSSWQSSTSYSDSGLQANKCYGYTVTARDSVSPTPNTGSASSISSTYTSANTPGTPTLTGATVTTLNLGNVENSNPAANPMTNFSAQVLTTTPSDAAWLNKWVNASGDPSATAVWLSDAQLDALVIRGLQSSTLYGVKVKARNQDADETASSAEGYGTTSTAPDTTAPAAVSNLATSGATQTSINLSWTAPGDDGSVGTATGYDIRYSTATITEGNWASATQATGEPTPSIAGSGESKTVTGLSAGTTYYFAIKTADEVPNTSAISNIASGTTTVAPDTTAPAAIVNLTATSTTQSSVGLSWTAPGDDGSTGTATSYDLRYSTSVVTEGNWSSATQATGEPTPLVAGTSQSMTVSSLSANTLYYFAIKTSDEVPNTSALSNVASTSTRPTPDATAPAAVTNLAASNATQNTADLSWTAPGDDGSTGTATTYDLRYSTATITEGNWASATQVTGEPTPSVAGSSESKTVTGLSAGTTYYFAIKTADEVLNTSSLSNVTNTTTLPTADTTAPAAVANLASSNPTPSTIDLSWTAPGDDGSTGTATSYDIRYFTATITEGNWASATQATGEPTPSVAGSGESMTVTGLAENTLYYFAIKTADEAPNTSALSNVASNTTTVAPDTTAPATISNLATSGTTQTSINLSWIAPGDDGSTGTATSYDIRYSTSLITDANWASAAPVTGEPTPQVAGTGESMTISGLSNSTTYFFAIKTADEVPNTSTLSNVASGATQAPTGDTTAPSATSNLAVGNATEDSVYLTWTSPGDDGSSGTAAYYDIRYSTATITGGNWASATQVSGEPSPLSAGTGQSMTVSSLNADTLYYFAIKTADEVPNLSALSNVVSLSTTAATAAPSINIPAVGGVAPSQIRISGYIYPGGKIVASQRSLIDALYTNIPLKELTVDESGAFLATLIALLQSQYLLVLTAEDKNGVKSGILSYSPDLLSESSFTVEDALFSPTIKLLNNSVAKNEFIEMSGYSHPQSKVEVEIDGIIKGDVFSDSAGFYKYSAPAEKLTTGDHKVRVHQSVNDKWSNFSPAKVFRVSVLAYPRADLNSDEVINIFDWSIFLFRWEGSAKELKKTLDLNQDGQIDISDFSIFLKLLTL